MKELDAIEPQTAGGETNPENINVEGNGSNGAIVGGMHDLTTLNILRWLNSSAGEGSVEYGATVWDMDPSYADEAGFLNGFEDTSMFGVHSTIFSGSEKAEGMQVLLPQYRAFYWDNITKLKHLDRAAASTVWATLSGVTFGGTRRINFKFKTSDDLDTLPESTVGIAPMFFLTGTKKKKKVNPP